MKVALITGSYPPEVCGVGDYTSALASSLNSAGAVVEIIHETDWSPLRMPDVRRRVLAAGADILHMQYPTKGYGWQLGPQILALSLPLVVTLHEASQVHVLRQLSLLPLTVRSPLVVMTTDFEQRYLNRLAPWLRGRTVVIPIGSNVHASNEREKMSAETVTYFGLIRPDKGLEKVIKLAEIFKQRGAGISVRIIGVPAPGCEPYYSRLRSESADLPIMWLIDMPKERMAQELARTSVAYLPFPDGASERRGSLIALMMNSAAIVTTRGEHTPPSMADALVFTETVEAAAALFSEFARQPNELLVLQRKAYTYSQRFDWQNIAAKHISAYTQLMNSKDYVQPDY